MALVIPDPRWETGELLYPRRKPVGKLAVDFSNPIARRLHCVYPLNQYMSGSGTEKSIIPNDKFGGFKPINGASWTPQGGQCLTDRDAIQSLNSVLGSGFMEDSTAMVVYRRKVASATYGYMFYYGQYQRYSPYVQAASSGLWGAGGTSSSPAITDASYNADNSPIKSCIMCRVKGSTTSYQLVEGRYMTTTGNGSLVGVSSVFDFGGRSSSLDRYSGCEIQAFMFWDRPLSATEMHSMNRDPYQLLLPA